MSAVTDDRLSQAYDRVMAKTSPFETNAETIAEIRRARENQDVEMLDAIGRLLPRRDSYLIPSAVHRARIRNVVDVADLTEMHLDAYLAVLKATNELYSSGRYENDGSMLIASQKDKHVADVALQYPERTDDICRIIWERATDDPDLIEQLLTELQETQNSLGSGVL